jgi:hypothetical protein
MTYNRSEIMRTAWSLFRTHTNRYSFRSALKAAWAAAKGGYELATPAQINTGDVVEIEYGTNDNMITCTITAITNKASYIVFDAVTDNGMTLDFCGEFAWGYGIKRLARAVALQAAA